MEECCDNKNIFIQIIMFAVIVELSMDINMFTKFLVMKMKII